ncbi:MAG: hypothetical protein WDW38_011320 [Sanguina aurantia]
MLLGSWVQPGAAKHILDIGTGTAHSEIARAGVCPGVIALMVAQKASPGAVVVAIDNDAAAVRQAAANAGGSAWAPQLHVRLVSVQRMASAVALLSAALQTAEIGAGGHSSAEAAPFPSVLTPAAGVVQSWLWASARPDTNESRDVNHGQSFDSAASTSDAIGPAPLHTHHSQHTTSLSSGQETHLNPELSGLNKAPTCMTDSETTSSSTTIMADTLASKLLLLDGACGSSSGSSGHDNGPGNNLSAPDSSTVVHAAGARTYGCFDLIVSNPPYFVSGTLSAKLASARHAGVSLPFGELAAAAASLLTQAGRLVLILPTAEAEVFDRAACIAGLTLVHILEVYTKSSDAKEKRRIHTYQHARSPTTPAADTSASTSKTHSGSSINSSVDASDQEQQQQEQRFSSALQGVRSDCDNPLDLPSSASQQQQQQQQLGSVIVQTPGRERLTIWELQPDSAPGQQFAYSDQYRAQTADFHHPDYM